MLLRVYLKIEKPKKLQTDKGKEIVLKNVQVFLKVMKYYASRLKVN